MAKLENKANHVSTSETLWEDLGFSAEEAAVMELKLSLHNEIMKVVDKGSLRARDLERTLDISQPRASELMNGKISHMTADRLTKYLHRLGRAVKVSTKKAELRGQEVA